MTRLKTPVEYVESLRSLEIRAYAGGEPVGSIVDNRSIAPHVNTVAKTYELAHLPEHREAMTAVSHLTGERIRRYTHMFKSAPMADDVINGTDDVPGWDDVPGSPLPGEVIADGLIRDGTPSKSTTVLPPN